MNQGNPPPNWYPDPKGEAELRYWDGNQWTEHTHSGQTAAQPAPAAPPPSTAPPAPSPPPLASQGAPTAAGQQPGYATPPPSAPAPAAPSGGGSGGGLGKKLPLIIGAVLAVAAVGVVLLLVLGGDDEPTESDRVKEATEEVITTGETSACAELATRDFLQKATLESGADAVRACEQNSEPLADGAELGDVEITGDKAVVEAALDGGELDGKDVELTMVKQDDQWRVDELARLDVLDGAAAEAAVKTTVFNFGSSEGPKACVYLAYSKLQAFQGGRDGCETEFAKATAANYTADSVDVSDKTATVIVTESKQGRTIEFTLAHEAGQWRIKDFQQQ